MKVVDGSSVDGNGRVEQGQRPVLKRGGDVPAFSNRGRITIHGNVVDGNLQCKSTTRVRAGAATASTATKEDQRRAR